MDDKLAGTEILTPYIARPIACKELEAHRKKRSLMRVNRRLRQPAHVEPIFFHLLGLVVYFEPDVPSLVDPSRENIRIRNRYVPLHVIPYVQFIKTA